jgi:hypothetical protein
LVDIVTGEKWESGARLREKKKVHAIDAMMIDVAEITGNMLALKQNIVEHPNLSLRFIFFPV